MRAPRFAAAALPCDEPDSPFEGLYQLDRVMTSRDEYGIWVSWPAKGGAAKRILFGRVITFSPRSPCPGPKHVPRSATRS